MWIIISIICFLFLFWLIHNLEERIWGGYTREWKPVKLAIWKWVLIIIGCLLPAVNVFMSVVLLAIIFIEIRVGDLRFKGGKKTWLDKLIDFLSKEI